MQGFIGQSIGVLDMLLFVSFGVYGLCFHSRIVEAKIEANEIGRWTKRLNVIVRVGGAAALLLGIIQILSMMGM